MADKHRVDVKIYGQEYTIRGTLPPEQIFGIARHVDQVMQEIAQVNPRLSTNRVAILSALTICEQLFEYKKVVRELEDEITKLSPREAKRAYHARKRGQAKEEE